MTDSVWEQRLQDLEKNLTRGLDLLKEYEEVLEYEDDPRKIAKYNREIQRQKKTIAGYELQYKELAQKLQQTAPEQLQRVEQKLQDIDRKIDVLVTGQVAISSDLYNLRQTLLSRYDDGERKMLEAITQQLNFSQLELTEKLLDGMQDDKVSEQEMSDMLVLVEQRLAELPKEESELIADSLQDSKSNIKHKLKIILPLILLRYEVEIELGSGFNIKSAWQKLTAVLGGHKG